MPVLIADSFGYPVATIYKQFDSILKDAPLEVGDWYRSNWVLAVYQLLGKYWSIHEGDDILRYKVNCYGEDVFAISNGIVIHSATASSSWYNVINVEHTLSSTYKIYSRYAHLKDRLFKVGDEVRKGEIIGHIGGPERGMAPHLHLSICVTDLLVRDPLNWPSSTMDIPKARAFIRQHYLDPLFFIGSRIAMEPQPPDVDPDPKPEPPIIVEGTPVTFNDMWIKTTGSNLLLRSQPLVPPAPNQLANVEARVPNGAKVRASDFARNGYRWCEAPGVNAFGFLSELFLSSTPPV